MHVQALCQAYWQPLKRSQHRELQRDGCRQHSVLQSLLSLLDLNVSREAARAANARIGTAAAGTHLPAQAQSTGFQLTATAAAALLNVSTADCTACSPKRRSRGCNATYA